MDAQHQQRGRNKHHSLHWSPQSPDNLCNLKCSPGHLTACSGLPEEPESHCSNGSERYLSGQDYSLHSKEHHGNNHP